MDLIIRETKNSAGNFSPKLNDICLSLNSKLPVCDTMSRFFNTKTMIGWTLFVVHLISFSRGFTVSIFFLNSKENQLDNELIDG